MRIFYGVQGTGNGHITRARVMAKKLYTAGFDVTFQFTGRPEHKYFDMDVFEQFQFKEGLTFNTNKGQVSYLKTAIEAKPMVFYKDVKSLDFSEFDLILCDYEPITAWAGKKQKKQVIGVGHQYAFDHEIPRVKTDPLADVIMRNFAPVDVGIGLHWHHFGQPILPPIIETLPVPKDIKKDKIVVYLPFEDPNDVVEYLEPFKEYEFHLYAATPLKRSFEHIIHHPLSREGFHQDLKNCVGIISNAGFELASESLQMGKKILAKPLHSQMEQLSNAEALSQLGYGDTMIDLSTQAIAKWLEKDQSVQVNYPDVAQILVDWIKQGMEKIDQEFIKFVWDQVEVSTLKT